MFVPVENGVMTQKSQLWLTSHFGCENLPPDYFYDFNNPFIAYTIFKYAGLALEAIFDF
jgi:hypothetical protein